MTKSVLDIDASVAVEADRSLIDGLFQFYVYDFSEFEPAGSDRFDLEADGRFAPYPHLDSYWGDASRIPFIIRRSGRLAGFALVNSIGHSGLAVDHNMAEFFVMRKHRRSGVASAAVRAILSGYPGCWEIAVAERNLGAQAFWPRAVAETPGVRDLSTLQGDGVQWSGPILRFTVDG